MSLTQDGKDDMRKRSTLRARSEVAALVLLGTLIFAALAWSGGTPRTERVSVSSSGTAADGHSGGARLSADGGRVAFASDASNLVAGDTNGVRDVFVRKLKSGKTQRISISSAGQQADGPSLPSEIELIGGPSLSADGRFVAFGSSATNLVADDTNGATDIFVRDLERDKTKRVSLGAGGAQGDRSSLHPALSGDGELIVFASNASNLVAGDTNGATDIFVRDLESKRTRRVSVSSAGAESDDVSIRPVISEDGKLVVFESLATNLAPGDANATAPGLGPMDMFAHDLKKGRTELVSAGPSQAGGNEGSFTGLQPAISADRRFVGFDSFASDLVAGDGNASFDTFVRDLKKDRTRLVSLSSDGAQGDAGSGFPSLTRDGRHVAFASDASNLVPGDTNGGSDIFVRDLKRDKTERVSVSSGGAEGISFSEGPSIAANGSAVVFDSVASNLVPGDTNASADVFVRRLRP